LQNLEQITLYQNCLTELPDSFAQLQKLEKLNLSWNDFSEFPEPVKKLKNLKWLAYFYNKPVAIPVLPSLNEVVLDRP
jgi:Leucine-rich repeat (LRR) protein